MLAFASVVFASTSDGTVSGYAWSENAGYINFGVATGNVHVYDSALNGYVWSSNFGWINLYPSVGGVRNDSEGNLSGYAWGENLGWINFAGVTINALGVFSGTATGDISGDINFSCSNCNMATDWRPESTRITPVFGGGNSIILSPEIVVVVPEVKPQDLEESFIEPHKEISLPQVPETPGFFAPIIDKIKQGLGYLLPDFIFKNQKQLAKIPKPVVVIPQTPQDVFAGKWEIFPKESVKKFVLSPLPKDIAVLAKKFPKLGKTFTDVGVGKITDVAKIKDANLSLPGLTETIGLSMVGIPVAKLTSEAKGMIPSEIIFVKTGGGLVDYNIALSLDNKGQTQQQIKTLAGSPLQLVFKADGNVKKVKGYIIFKSRNPQPVSATIPLDSMASSPIFSAPNFTASLIPIEKVPLEGAKVEKPIVEDETLEKRLVIAEFEYIDTGNGVYTAVVQAPVVYGEYEIVTVVDYESDGLLAPVSRETKLVTVVDPEGYVYEKNGEKETRIVGAVVSLFWQNPETKQYELWRAGDYQQENPQVTNVSGSYSFLVPEGYYYLKVDAPGYLSYDGKPFSVKEGSGVHINIELKTKYWLVNIVDWKTLLLVIVILMLGYNFYKDKKRETQKVKV